MLLKTQAHNIVIMVCLSQNNKTHNNSSSNVQISTKPTVFHSFCNLCSLKPTRIIAKTQKVQKKTQLSSASTSLFLKTHSYGSKDTKSPVHAGAGFLPVRASSVEEHLPHALTQLRTHARTHDTNTKRNRNRFPDWVQLTLNSPQSPTFMQTLGS